ncbi:hypothetical protein GQ53DRAFT_753151 [Thozetella sp. PMI_491]|nr:hypothetical protein GQ53DRAFT_753151 [Thozetella sp. PMI_491]
MAESKVGSELAETRAHICMLGLGVLQESWPVGGWVYRLFASITGRLREKLRRSRPPSPWLA